MPRYYRVLQDNGATVYGGSFRYDLPKWKGPKHNGRWIPGQWMPEVKNPELCVHGYHACTREQVLGFLGYGLHIYLIELRGTIIIGNDKVVASEARLLEELPWGAEAARFFAVECAADVLPLMKDERSIAALETAFRFACGDATPGNRRALAVARRAAGAVATSREYSVAGPRMYLASRSAAATAGLAEAPAVEWAAKFAAESIAESAAYSAAYPAMYWAVRARQTDRLMWWLGEK